jgi:hypothetical protein
MPSDSPLPQKANLAANQSFASQGLSPRQIVSAYDAGQWEEFINEWTQGLKSEYAQVQRFSGAGDRGRDVAGFLSVPVSSSAWDNYQCKHYKRPLSPSDIWIELGKLCYFTFVGDYTIPRKYRFVAPNDVGPKLKDLLLKPNELRKELLANWAEHCAKAITDTKPITLASALLKHVNQFDFSIVGYSPLVEVIEQHMKTRFWATRFRFTPPARPVPPEPPIQPAPHEARYVQQLLDAYGDAEKRTIPNLNELEKMPRYHEHLKRSRQWFFQAEALDRFSRDNYPNGEFEKIKKQILDGVIDTAEGNHEHGFACVCAATDRAADLVLGNCELASFAEVGDKKGVCHHLANEDKLKWVRS